MILPKPINNFVGREFEINKIVESLDPKNRHWIISLQGIGGIGKTELAIFVANYVKRKNIFKYTSWVTAKDSWLDLDGIKSKQNSLILDDLLNNIIIDIDLPNDLLKRTNRYKWEAIMLALATKKVLIVVDNLETITDNRIFQFLNEIPPGPSKAMVTTRVDETFDFFVQRRLESKKIFRIGPLSDEEAIELFIKELENPKLQSQDNELIKVVLTKISNIPLAIYWVAGKVKLGKLTLSDAVNELTDIKGDVLKFCFENLINSINNASLKLLQTFTVFASDVSKEGLCFVAQMDSSRFNKAIDTLISASLVEFKVNILGNYTYSVLPPTRIYINALWDENIELKEDFHLNATDYYLKFLAREVEEENWSKIDSKHSNISYIFFWCFENEKHELVIELAKYMILYLNRIGIWDERLKVAELSAKSANNLGDKASTVKFMYDEAILYKQRGEFEHAIKLFEKTKQICLETNDNKNEILCIMQIGIIQGLLNNLDKSNNILVEAEIRFSKSGDRINSAICIHLIGRNERRKGNFQKALEYFEKSMHIKKEENADRNIAIGLYDIAYCYYLMGKIDLSEETFSKSLKSLKKIGDKRHLSNAYWYYANLKKSRNKLDEAILLLNKVIDRETELQRERHLNRAQKLLSLTLKERQSNIELQDEKNNFTILEKDKKQHLEEIRNTVKKNNLLESFILMSNLESVVNNNNILNEVIILESQYNLIEKQRNLDIIKYDDYLIVINKIKTSILSILDKNT